MDFKQTWSGISKILLQLDPVCVMIYRFEFVRLGEDSLDEILSADQMFWVNGSYGHGLKEDLERRFTEELLLKHTVVDGVDEYSV
jgi:hypothetical protein